MADTSKKIYSRSFFYLKKHYLAEFFILILILFRNAGSLVFPYYLMVIIDEIFPAVDYALLLKTLGILVGIQLFSSLAGILSTYLQQKVSNRIMEDIRSDLFEHVIHLPVDFYNNNDVGEVVHSLSNEVNIIKTFLTSSLIQFTSNMVLITGISVILYFLNPFLFLICIGIIPVLLIAISFFHAKLIAYIGKDRKADAAILSFIIEKLDNVILIKLFNQYQFELKNLGIKIKDYVNVNLKGALLNAQGTQISIFIIAVAPILVIAVGSKDIFNGLMSLGTLVAFIEYFNIMIGPSQNMVGLYYSGLRAREAMSKIMTFFQIPIPEKEKINASSPALIHTITCEQVQLILGDRVILQNIDLTFKKGKCYGFVGGSGSGKSSLTFLLCGLYKPNQGKILINDQDAKELGIYAICEKIGLVRSNTKLQKGSIRENLLYGVEKADDQALTAVLKTTGLYDYVQELPRQLDTDISDLGTRLSDGQRQRLSIARALLKDTQVLILDEATSAMDSMSENEVIGNILNIYQDRILIVISHRLSTIQNMDEIICLKDGTIVEKNNHNYLIEFKGAYWQLFEKQLIHE
ncbi:MAG: ABC transporter ATP-binding protein [Saprospiraceae bacterium]|nr:ABC transporter ATP-binding protein [Saprospiraceae bacterium]